MQEMLHLYSQLNSAPFDLCFVWKILKDKHLCCGNIFHLAYSIVFLLFIFASSLDVVLYEGL